MRKGLVRSVCSGPRSGRDGMEGGERDGRQGRPGNRCGKGEKKKIKNEKTRERKASGWKREKGGGGSAGRKERPESGGSADGAGGRGGRGRKKWGEGEGRHNQRRAWESVQAPQRAAAARSPLGARTWKPSPRERRSDQQPERGLPSGPAPWPPPTSSPLRRQPIHLKEITTFQRVR